MQHALISQGRGGKIWAKWMCYVKQALKLNYKDNDVNIFTMPKCFLLKR